MVWVNCRVCLDVRCAVTVWYAWIVVCLGCGMLDLCGMLEVIGGRERDENFTKTRDFVYQAAKFVAGRKSL